MSTTSGWTFCRNDAANMPMLQAVINKPTVFTSQISVFGPVTAIKLLMCKIGHIPARK
ncbi:hypothetical protein I5M27_06705 [Adhaeribacter sp. BT258]|uniref:Uncharacterized protein n=1 Tax=Adhaeribacter terrigena TaxID=2793070 RepID=A0ABS1C026_9BACT|nr:hypothetical protein [Adhaeribacter terrigena]MBK0402668.1 hypothetical protein [Adhaeribacter terrigena]